MHVTYTPNYPEELPEYEIETIEGQIPSSYYNKIRESVKQVVSRMKSTRFAPSSITSTTRPRIRLVWP